MSSAATNAEKLPASLQGSFDALCLEDSLPPAVVTTTPLDRVRKGGRVAFTVTDLFIEWGAGEAASGLDPFAGGPLARVDAEVTARTWQHLLFEGDVDTAPLIGPLPTFICRSRLEALKTIAPRLTRLDHGVLHGQRNCFALLGARGVGKTHFMKSLARIVASIARPSTCVIYVNLKSAGLREPLQLLQEALRRPGQPDAAKLALPEHLLRPDTGMDELLEFMREHRRRAVLLLDEVEVLYLRADERRRRIYDQLHAMGECSGAARPIMAVLTGSAAVLRSLLFAIPGCKGIEEQYKAYLDFASLNDRKYMPLALRPMVAADDVRRAILCISSGAALDVDALRLEGDLVEPSRGGSSSDDDRDGGPAGGAGARGAERRAEGTAVGGAGSASSTEPGSELINALADGYSVSDEFLLWVCARCRGLASWIEDALRDRSSRTDRRYHVARLLGDEGERADRLRRLLDAWVGHTVAMSKSTAVAAADIYDETVCDFALRLMVDEPTAPWLELMDCGAAFVNESADGFRVHFLHPSDAGTLLLLFRTEGGSPERLTLAEELSLLRPQLASADEINEQLVFESIAWKASAVGGGLRLLDMVVAAGVRKGDRHICLGDLRRTTVAELIHPDNAGVLSKEFPDERGGDGAAWLPRMLTRLLANILMRVQVKLASLGSKTCVSGRTAQRWVDKLVATSGKLVELISCELDASEPVVACHVFWVAQTLSGPALEVLSNAEHVSLLVHSGNMLEHWAPRVRQFVVRERLVQYGYTPAPAGAAGAGGSA